MPLYVYRCPCGHETEREEPMLHTQAVDCPMCGNLMQRKPQAVAVNWNGPKPSRGGMSQLARDIIDGAPLRREEAAKKYDS